MEVNAYLSINTSGLLSVFSEEPVYVHEIQEIILTDCNRVRHFSELKIKIATYENTTEAGLLLNIIERKGLPGVDA